MIKIAMRAKGNAEGRWKKVVDLNYRKVIGQVLEYAAYLWQMPYN